VEELRAFWQGFSSVVPTKITLALACSTSSFYGRAKAILKKPFGNLAFIPFSKLNVVYRFYVINIAI
jgi:hypothetical protein